MGQSLGTLVSDLRLEQPQFPPWRTGLPETIAHSLCPFRNGRFCQVRHARLGFLTAKRRRLRQAAALKVWYNGITIVPQDSSPLARWPHG